MDLGAERAIRHQVFDALARVVADQGELVTREQLSAFTVAGTTRRLIDQSRGTWNPRDLAATLSVVSSPDGPYRDSPIENNLFRYDCRTGSTDGDNAKLRAAHELDLPILLLLKERAHDSVLERRYAERLAKHRLRQARFRGIVLRAYGTRCAVCSLRHGRLLDAAHIIGDRAEGGEPVVGPCCATGCKRCTGAHLHFPHDAQTGLIASGWRPDGRSSGWRAEAATTAVRVRAGLRAPPRCRRGGDTRLRRW